MYSIAQKHFLSLYDTVINPPVFKVIADYEPATNNVKELPQNLYTELSDYWKKSSDNITFSKLEQVNSVIFAYCTEITCNFVRHVCDFRLRPLESEER